MRWRDMYRRYFSIAGITVCVESDLDFNTIRFRPEFAQFAVDGPGDDNVTLRHHFGLPDLRDQDLGKEIYRKAPWAISRKNGSWIYLGISSDEPDPDLNRVAIFNAPHTQATIYNPLSEKADLSECAWNSLSRFPTDQIWLAPLLADRSATLLHSAGVILNGRGLLFVGNSEAGKSTTVITMKAALANGSNLRRSTLEILCDDRNIVRRWEEGWRIHGTWSHGDVPDVSSKSAPLAAILFLQQDVRNEIVPVTDRKEIWKRLLTTLIKSAATADWWEKELSILEQMVFEVPFYMLHLDQSGAIVEKLVTL